jgi:predicted nucleotidyltransferase
MLNKLFSSKSEVEILKLFLFNPDNSFYQRQISQLTSQSIRGVQREVNKLEKIGLIESSTEGNRIYYKINRRCPIFKELRAIFLKTAGIAEVLKDALEEKNIKIAFIYGSYAKNKENFSSDIDLMIIGDISSKMLSGILSKPKRKLLREINYVVFSPEELIKRILDKNHFIESVLEGKKVFIIGDRNEFKTLVESAKQEMGLGFNF